MMIIKLPWLDSNISDESCFYNKWQLLNMKYQ